MVGRVRTSSAAAAAAGLSVLVMASGAAPAGGPADYGFVLTKLATAFYQGDEKIDCPEGRSPSMKDSYLATRTPAERARLLKPENAEALEHGYKVDYVQGPGGTDICTVPEAFDSDEHPVQKIGQSPIGPGLDLDGVDGDAAPAAGTCAHKSFTGVSGERGVDNQYFRAIACNTLWRGVGGGKGDFLGESPLNNGAAVLVVRGVDSWENDPQVEVVIASSPDKAPTDVRQQIVDGGSMAMTDDARYRAVLPGRIENGVLIAGPADVRLPDNWVGASGGEYILRHARLRARVQPDGKLAGEAGGYRPIDNAIGVQRVGGPGVASTAGVDCASVRRTLKLLADGDRDPKTGACTTVSMGLEIAAAPAFVFDRGALVGAPRGGAVRSASR